MIGGRRRSYDTFWLVGEKIVPERNRLFPTLSWFLDKSENEKQGEHIGECVDCKTNEHAHYFLSTSVWLGANADQNRTIRLITLQTGVDPLVFSLSVSCTARLQFLNIHWIITANYKEQHADSYRGKVLNCYLSNSSIPHSSSDSADAADAGVTSTASSSDPWASTLLGYLFEKRFCSTLYLVFCQTFEKS